MDNKTIAKAFKLLAQLQELHDQNSFKIKSINNAAFKIDKLPQTLSSLTVEEIEKVDGIGKGIAAKIVSLLTTGTLPEINELLAITPPGVVEMLSIKGIGPKKIAIIWRELQIETVGELFYACNENRLVEAKGFGLKTQEEIHKSILFKMAASGRFLYARVEPIIHPIFNALLNSLTEIDPNAKLTFSGEFRRACEIIDEVILIGASDLPIPLKDLDFGNEVEVELVDDKSLIIKHQSGLKIRFEIVLQEHFYLKLFKTTGNQEHVNEVLKRVTVRAFTNEEAIYADAGLSYIEPELREGLNEIDLAAGDNLPNLIHLSDLKGTLHNHSTWSDGVHSLSEMAHFCKDVLGLSYLGICDHSKSAFYAKGLNEQRVFAQHQEIDALNLQLAPFKIFKGIESDILNDGSLDYSDDILKTFDFVVASVHTPLRMDEEKATARLIKAIENPFTTILGHPTGRLLLSRAGYPINYEKVIDACAANGVVIEINANPLRLDLDWRWHRYALNKGVLLSINPDAHRNEGFYDMKYGVLVARKGGLTANQNLNSMDLVQISSYFKNRKDRALRGI